MSPGRRAPLALVALLVLAPRASAAPGDEPRRTYLRRAQDQDGPVPRLLEDLEAALRRDAPGEAAYLLDRLLEEAAAPDARGVVVERAAGSFMGLRAHVLERCADLPRPVIDALRGLQTRAAEGAARSAPPEAILLRYPLATRAADACRTLAARAIAAGDLAAARARLDELAVVCPPEQPEQPGAPERAALALLAAAAERATPTLADLPPGPPEVRWSAAIGPGDDPAPAVCLVHPAYARSAGGERVVASSGARVVVLDAADGAVVGRFPAVLEAATRPPDAFTRFAARVGARHGLAFTPLVLERWLTPARGEGATDFAGRFYSLVALDLDRGRLLWWDGDPGPRARGAPTAATPGLAAASPSLVDAVRTAHVVGVAADGARVYVALLPKDDEPELSLFAYERAGGATQPLVLRPAWSAPVRLFAAERPARVSPDDEPVAPELAAALTVDGAGGLLVTTDAGVAACLDVGTGDVRWLVRPEPAPLAPRTRLREFGRARRLPDAPPEPARLVDGDDQGPRVALLAGDQLMCLRLRDGAVAWSVPRGRAERALVTGTGHVVAYGQGELLIVDAATGARRHAAPAEENVCGEGVAVGRTLLLPVRDGAAAKLRRIDLQVDGAAVTPRRSALASLPDHAPPLNLALSPHGMLAASGRTLTLHAWER